MNYLQQIAEQIKTHIPEDDLPDENMSRLLLLYATLLLAKGTSVTSRDVHNAWVAWMSEINPNHQSLIPYEQLDPSTRSEDSPFVTAIKKAAADTH